MATEIKLSYPTKFPSRNFISTSIVIASELHCTHTRFSTIRIFSLSAGVFRNSTTKFLIRFHGETLSRAPVARFPFFPPCTNAGVTYDPRFFFSLFFFSRITHPDFHFLRQISNRNLLTNVFFFDRYRFESCKKSVWRY